MLHLIDENGFDVTSTLSVAFVVGAPIGLVARPAEVSIHACILPRGFASADGGAWRYGIDHHALYKLSLPASGESVTLERVADGEEPRILEPWNGRRWAKVSRLVWTTSDPSKREQKFESPHHPFNHPWRAGEMVQKVMAMLRYARMQDKPVNTNNRVKKFLYLFALPGLRKNTPCTYDEADKKSPRHNVWLCHYHDHPMRICFLGVRGMI